MELNTFSCILKRIVFAVEFVARCCTLPEIFDYVLNSSNCMTYSIETYIYYGVFCEILI